MQLYGRDVAILPSVALVLARIAFYRAQPLGVARSCPTASNLHPYRAIYSITLQFCTFGRASDDARHGHIQLLTIVSRCPIVLSQLMLALLDACFDTFGIVQGLTNNLQVNGHNLGPASAPCSSQPT